MLNVGLRGLAALSASGGGRVSEGGRITFERDKFGGRPCIRGLRIQVRDVRDLLAEGAERAEILADYPYLEDADVTAALTYAAQVVSFR